MSVAMFPGMATTRLPQRRGGDQRQLERPQKALGVMCGLATKSQPLATRPLIRNPADASSEMPIGNGKMLAGVVHSAP